MSHDWRNILVTASSSIRDVLKVIDSEALKLALVVDDDDNLLGTISDGDIRRALISDKSLDHKVLDIMNTNPTTVSSDTPRENIVSLMDEKELFAIPLLNNRRVVGLETLHNAIHKAKYDNPVFIMAGGFGSRLKPLTDNCPKPLLEVGGKPILETVISRFINSGFSNFYISTHYLPQMIIDYFGNGEELGVSIEYIHEENPLGTGGALGLLPQSQFDLPVIVMNADILTKINFAKLLQFHNKNKSNLTMCVREYEYQVPFGVVQSEAYKIVNLVEKPTQRFHVNAGIYVVGHEVIQSVKHNQYIDMPSLFENHIGNQAFVYPFHDYWLDIGRMDDFKRAQDEFKTLGL